MAAISLGDHHQAAAVALEQVDVGIHASGRGGAKRTAGQTGRFLGGTGVVDRMGLEIVGQRLARIELFLELGVGDITSHDDRAGQAAAAS